MSPRILLPLLALAASAFAQRFPFKHYGREHGLTNLTPQCILQDRTGFLWVGTQNGLFRYDGVRFTGFGTVDGLPGSSVESLHESADGTLFIGTNNGLARRVESGFEKIPITAGRDSVRPQSVASSPDGTLYVGTNEGLAVGHKEDGAYRFDVLYTNGAREPARGVHVDSAGDAWFWCGRKVCQYRSGTLRAVSGDLDAASSRGAAILGDRAGNLWARCAGGLFLRRKGESAFQPVTPRVPPSEDFSSLGITQDGRVLVPTDLGLSQFDGTSWSRITRSNGLPTDATTFAFQDREGSIWIGLGGTGLARWIGYGQWENWAGVEGPGNDNIWGITRDRRGTLWVTTDVGLHYLEPTTGGAAPVWKRWTRGLPRSTRIYFVRPAPDGAVWVAGADALVARIDPKTGAATRFGPAEGFTAKGSNQGQFDREGRFWISTYSGLYRTAPNPGPTAKFEQVTIPGEQSNASYEVFLNAADGSYWTGGRRGLFRLADGQWTRFTDTIGLKPDRISRLAQDATGAIWIGYRGALGLTRLTFVAGKPEVHHVTSQDGLHSDQPISLGSDAGGRIWYCTDNGIEVLEGGAWRHFSRNDGLVWDDSNGNAFHGDSDGSVWIGTSGGLSHFLAQRAAKDVPRAPAPVVRVSLSGASSGPSAPGGIRVPYGSAFTIQFALLSFANEAAVRFRHRLIGAETEWIATNARDAHYAGLPPGSYRFEVQARDGDGPWSDPAAVAIDIPSPWWRSWPALILYALSAAGLIRVAWRWRIRSMMDTQRRLRDAVAERTAEIERLLEEARQTTMFKSQFLANMSHEIRTPMNGILGLTELTLGDQLTPEQRINLRLVQSSAESLLTIINDILDFSKVEAGRMELQLAPFSLREQVDGAFKLMRLRAAEKDLELNCKLDGGLPDRLIGDPNRLRQILLNLLGNAVKFTEKGSVSMRVSGEPVEGDRLELHFAISDTGIGIPAGKLDSIFEAFQQAEGSVARRYGGTGLGLAIARQLVTLMNGRMWVHSEEGAGSTFHFTARFDAASEPAATQGVKALAAAIGGSSSGPGPVRILVAEDNAVNQRLIRGLLERRGYQVSLAADGTAVVDMHRAGSFDLILMDLHMPGMDGMAATRAIRDEEQRNPRANVARIIALTADALVGDRERCLTAGMDGYISKPINTTELYRVIEEHQQALRG